MKDKVYQLMNWPKIEALEYEEEEMPEALLGPQAVGNNVILYQCYFKDAKKVSIVWTETGKKTAMEPADENGFFAALVTGKSKKQYQFLVETQNGEKLLVEDPYQFTFTVSDEDIQKLKSGIHYKMQECLGANEATIDGIEGTKYVFYSRRSASVALCLKGMKYYMSKQPGTNLFRIFIPGVSTREPFTIQFHGYDGVVRQVYSLFDRERTETHTWKKDTYWMYEKKNDFFFPFPVHFKEEVSLLEQAKDILPILQSQRNTHVILDNVYQDKDNLFFAAKDFGSVTALQTVVEFFHKNHIGVIAKWNPNIFRPAEYRSTFKRNLLVSNLLYWIETLHLDGYVMDSLAPMLYLDYGKKDGEWKPNLYGGVENLEAVELVKHCNSVASKMYPELILIGNIAAIWPNATKDLQMGGLGFTYRFNTDMEEKLLHYICTEPYSRVQRHNALIYHLSYVHSENFLNAFRIEKENAVWNSIPGTGKEKVLTLKALCAFWISQPGLKVADFASLIPEKEKKLRQEMQEFQALCFADYAQNPALVPEKEDASNFQWINNVHGEDCGVSYIRTTQYEDDCLLYITNFSQDIKDIFRVGVPFEGKYRVVMDSTGETEGEEYLVTEKPWDGRNYSILLTVPALSCLVLQYVPYSEEEIFRMVEAKADLYRDRLRAEAKLKIATRKERLRNP